MQYSDDNQCSDGGKSSGFVNYGIVNECQGPFGNYSRDIMKNK